MPAAVLIMAILLPMLMAAAFLLARYLYRRPAAVDELSPVTRQHIDLFQGGQLSEAAVESAKERIRNLLEQGEVEAVEASLRPGTHFVIHVRALAEIGTDDAGGILERQLQRRHTDDQIEQVWYWIDLAGSLRAINREQSLPQLLRCAETAHDLPLGHFFAAETVCFLSFSGYLRQPQTPLGQTALRVLHRALEGLRFGVPSQVIAEGRLGEAIESLWDHRPETVEPLVVRVFVEALRQVRRAPHVERTLTEDKSEQEAFQWQTVAVGRPGADARRLPFRSSELPVPPTLRNHRPRPTRRAWCLDRLACRGGAGGPAAPGRPSLALPRPGRGTPDLVARSERRASAAGLGGPANPDGPSGPEALSGESAAASFGCRRTCRIDSSCAHCVAIPRRKPSRSCCWPPAIGTRPTGRRPSAVWVGGSRSIARRYMHCLHEARRDVSPEVRQAARAALARLGERQTLQWFRQALCNEDTQTVHETIQAVANEGLTLLWPDLDRLADADDNDVAHHAREALERSAKTSTGGSGYARRIGAPIADPTVSPKRR